jgi:hypothetical protein
MVATKIRFMGGKRRGSPSSRSCRVIELSFSLIAFGPRKKRKRFFLSPKKYSTCTSTADRWRMMHRSEISASSAEGLSVELEEASEASVSRLEAVVIFTGAVAFLLLSCIVAAQSPNDRADPMAPELPCLSSLADRAFVLLAIGRVC